MITPTLEKKIRALKILLPAHISAMIKPKPLWSHLWVTRRCNLTCDYCFVLDYEKEQLNTKEMKTVINKLFDLGNRFISFVGGEPTIRKDFLKLVNYACKKGMVTHFTTNGVMLDKDKTYINKIGNSGIDIINLSIDSILEFNSTKKDYIRNKSVLDTLLKAREKFGFEVVTNLVLTSKNLDTVIPTVEKMNQLNVPMSIGLISKDFYTSERKIKTPVKPDYSLFFDNNEKLQMLFPIVDELIQLKRKGYGIINVEDYFKDIKRFLSGERVNWYCSGGEYYLSVDCDGKVGVCSLLSPEEINIHSLKKNALGNMHKIREQRLAECHTECLSLCFYQSSYYVKKPQYFIKQSIKSAFRNSMRSDFNIFN